MNRKYIDFVPANNTPEPQVSVRAVKRTRVRTVVRTQAEPQVELPMQPQMEEMIQPQVQLPVRPRPRQRPRPSVRQTVSRPQPRPAMVTRKRVTRTAPAPVSEQMPGGPALGVIEDLNTHFVNTNVPKRPLSAKPAQPSVAELKAKRVKTGLSTKAPVKPAVKTEHKAKTNDSKSTYKPPKTNFINQNKVVKRPLSGNVYQKKATPAKVKEEPKGPVTIITKPEKEKHIGIIVTIIITIILGAAAGTVAFLLLPK